MKSNLFCFFLITFSFIGESQEFKQINTVEEQLEDFKVFKTTLLECHSGIFDYNDSLSLYSNLSQVEKKLQSKSLTRIEQLALYSKFVSSIKCIHSIAYHKEMTIRSLEAKFLLPFELYFLNNELRLKENYISDPIRINKNDKIITINGELVNDIKDSLYQFIPSDGNNISRKNQILKTNFLYYYFLYNQRESNFKIEYIHQKDTLKNVFKPSYSDYPKRKKSKKKSEIRYSIDTTRGLAVLNLPKPLLISKKYKKDLTSFMANIKSLGIQNLVLDLRNNGGGKSQGWFAGFFVDTNMEYARTEYTSIHNTTYKRHFIHKLKLQFLISKLMSRFSRNDAIDMVEPKTQFNGQLFVLINGNTGSAASNLASFLKEWTNALIVGEESGGGYKSCNTGGGTLQLPNSKIRIGIRTIKFYNNTCHKYEADGVTPDFIVKETDYFKIKGDEQLNFVLNNLIQTEPNMH
jgi:hypothetical protein